MRRPVMHSTHKDDIRFIFRGGIIIVCNHNLGKSAIEQAIGTRIRVIHMDLSATELLVLMKTICADGYKFGRDQLSPQECWQVAEFIREEFSRLSRDLDIRLLINSFKDRLFWRSGVPKSHWKDLVRARIRKTVAVGYRSRREVTAEEAAIAMEIYSQAGLTLKQKIDAWNERTGKSQGAFYRALNRSRAK